MLDSGQTTGAQSSSALVLTSGKATFYLNNSKQTTSNVMTATASNGNVLLTGLDRGAVTSGSLDAINGSQLYATNQNVSNLSNVVNNIGGANGVKYFHANSTQTDSLASGTESIAVGVAAVSSGAASIAQGAMASASGNNSVALGTGASATGSNSVALGSNSVARSSTLGSAGFNAGSAALSAATASGELSIGGVGTERRITNVAAGYSATDAVNVSQLMSENAKVNQMGANTAAAMGGNSSFNSTTGAITNPTYVVAKGTYNSVGAALTALDNSKGGDNPLAVAYDDTSKNQITLQGANGATKIANLTAGTSPNDAVNVSQLSGVTAALGGGAAVNADGSVKPPSYTVYGNTFSNVGDALSNISSSTANLVQNVKYIKFGDSIADQAQASGNNSIALGGDAFANADNSIAIGTGARAMAANSVALGVGSTTNAANTVSVGTVTAQRRIVNMADGVGDSDAATVGQMNQSDAALQAQISALATPKLLKSSALLGATSDSDPATVGQLKGVANALGGGATVATDGSVSAPAYVVRGATYSNVGDAVANVAKVTDKIAFGPASGNYAQASGTDSIAVGGGSFATSNGAVAMGLGARAMAPGSVAIGYGSAATVANTFAVGSSTAGRRIVNVADGINDTDAATVGQVTSDIQAAISNLQASTVQNPTLLKSAMLQSPQLLGQTSSLTPDQMLMAGPTQKGGGIQATGTDSVAIGLSAKATADSALAIGSVVTVTDNMGVGIGQNIAAKGTNTVVIGSNTSALGSGVIAIGNNYTAVDGDGAVGIGNNVNVGALNSVAIGTNTVASGTNSVTLGYASTDGGRANVISVGNTKTGGQRQIINVAAGTQKTDAVNVSQLTGVTAALGGGATVNTDGSIKPPTYNVQNTAATDVGTAIAKLDGAVTGLGNNLTTLNTTVNNILNGGGIKYFHANSALGDSSASGAESVAIGGGAVATTANSVALGSNSVASSGTLGASGFAPGGATLTAATAFGEVSVGASGKERRITNVAAGYAATDAVNVSQLMAEDQKVNNVSANVSNLSDTVNNIKKGGGSLTYFHANSSLTDSTASGVNSISVGPQATAAGTNAIAVGYNASATAADSVALGSNATTTANLSATAYNPGNSTLSGTTASGEVSVGNGSFNRRITNVAAGSAATDAVNVSQLMSENAKVDAQGAATAAALGGGSSYTPTTGNISAPTYIAGGTTYNNVAGAITNIDGRLANVTGGTGDGIKYFHANSSLADSSAAGKDSVAIGGAATASTSNSVALGSNSLANSTTLGSAGFAPGGATLSAATAFGEVSVGAVGKERRITNVAAGYAATDAVNVSQLMAEDGKVNNVSNNVTYLNNLVQNFSNNIYNGEGVKYFHANSSLADSSAAGKDSVAIGGAATASTANSVALGSNSTANSTTLGSAGFAPGGATLSAATAFGEVSVGAAGKERRITNVAAGYAVTDAVNVSQLMAEDAKVNNVSNNVSDLNNAVNNIQAGGANMKYFKVNSSLADASAGGVNSVAAGPNASATASNAVALGANAVADRANTVSVGTSDSQRQVVNVAAGTNANDAVTVKQLSGVTAALGSGASVNADGSIKAPAYAVLGNTYSNVGDALSGIMSASSNLQTAIKYINFGPSTAGQAQAQGADAVAIGGDAFANGNGTLAIGAGARAMAPNSVALGVGSVTSAANSVAVGSATAKRRIVNLADGVDDSDAATVGQMTTDIASAIAGLQSSLQTKPVLKSSSLQSPQLLGQTSSLTPDQMLMAGPTVKGGGIQATGTDSVAIGLSAKATADSALAIGSVVTVTDMQGVGIGQNIAAKGVGAVVIGSTISGLGSNVIAIGNNYTSVEADNAIGIGNNLNIGAVNGVAIGKDIIATGSNSVTLGYASNDGGRANVLSVGNTKSGGQRQIINVAAGTKNTDVVNVSQLAGVASALGGGASVNPTTGAVVAPAYTLAGNTYVNVAAALTSLDTRIASSGDPLAVDYDTATKDQITLKGATGTKITGLTAGALSASSTEAINGSQLFAQGTSMAKALGGGASVNTATGEITAPAYTFGGGTYTNVADALTALNNAAGSGNALGVVYDSDAKSQITLAGATGTKITKVAAGDVNASSTDAMNGAQLYNVAASTADAIGGGSTFDPSTGKITNPTFNIGGKTITNIAGAITNLDDRVYANATDITNLQTQINEGGIGLVTQDATSKNILVASQTDGSIVDFAGTKGARRLTGVAAGNVNASSFDAVNGTQLYNVAASTANAIGGGSTVKTDGTISNPTYIVGGSTVTTIGGAITNLDARVYANSTDITNLQTQINEGGIGLVTQNQSSRNITVASQTDGSIVDFTNSTKGARVLTGVAAGTGDFDAVNVAQLKAAGIINPDGVTKAAVTYDTTTDNTGKTVTNYSSITLGDGSSGAAPVTIHNVAAGEKDTDAVNYSQYADLLSKVNSISNAGTGVDTLFVGDGDRNTEQAKAGGTHATAMGALSVANGLQSVATGYASNASGSNAVAIGANSTASGNNSVALGAGSVATEDNTVSVGSASQQRRVTNVAAGTATTDAVNVGQLNDAITNASNNTVNQAVQQSNSYTDSQFNKMNDKMNSLGAAAMAATSLIPNARAEGNFQMSAAAGTYGGAAAVAVGANYWVNDRFLVNAHVTRATGNGASTGASAGVTIGF
ncbi:YadA-like family protein [Paraburkholderia caribensis]|uniref:YadA-like family protein n=1 Tax=Paraburkholderia caribensis TaxID=75105 RepID=UPI001F45C447|nr:YadA-like family protein [Paraburkholderia caribensis]